MIHSDPTHPRDGEAAEYVLGTLPAEERRAFESTMARDPALARIVARWQDALHTLSTATPSVEPRPGLLEQIEAAITEASGRVVDLRSRGEIAALRRSRALWRSGAAVATALAAGLAAVAILDRVTPGPVTGDLLAVVNRSGDLPALVVRVDTATGTVRVRSVAADVPAGRSLELWAVAPGAQPRSLGLVGASDGRLAARPDLRDGVTLAVSVEPPGGSATGGPTGPVVYSGRLVPDPR